MEGCAWVKSATSLMNSSSQGGGFTNAKEDGLGISGQG